MDYLSLAGRPVADFETYARFYLMEPLPSSGAGVNVQHILQIPDSFYTEDVAVPANEDIRRIGPHFGGDSPAPSPGMAADVRHPEAETLELELLVLGRTKPYRASIYITPDRAYRRQLLELVQDVRRSNIAGMEYQINLSQVFGQGRMKVGMGVGEDP